MADRDVSNRNIETLYGCPGADYDSETGDLLLLELFEEHGGLSLLTDVALAKLAALHLREDERVASRYEARV